MGEILGLIPARAGSRSIPGKNVKPFLGRPLLAWTIETALESKALARVVLSTDDAEYAAIGRAWGAEAPFLRPAHLAGDASPTAATVAHAVRWLGEREGWAPAHVMVLEPTSPGRRPFHVREAAALLAADRADSVASVSPVPHHFVPPKVLTRRADGTLVGADGTHPRDMVHRRQDLAAYYAFDGLVFGCRTELVLAEPPTLWGPRVVGYVVDARYAVDIDRPQDWAVAEARVRELLEEETRA
jgi:CMP-N-acetylneuraminic acid synthetase